MHMHHWLISSRPTFPLKYFSLFRRVFFLSPFCRWENRGFGRLSNQSKASLLVNGKARMQTQSYLCPPLITGLVFLWHLFEIYSFLQILLPLLYSPALFREEGAFLQRSEKRERSWKNKSVMNLFWKMRACEGSVELACREGGYSGPCMCFRRMRGNEGEKQKVNQDRAGSNGRHCYHQQRKGKLYLQKWRVND